MPSFLMIDIDLKDFVSKDKLDSAMKRVLKRIKSKMRGYPKGLWTGNRYRTYQLLAGFILEQVEVFAKYIDQNGKISLVDARNLQKIFRRIKKEILNTDHP